MREELLDRFKGAFLGLAFGDALGAPAEGMSPYDTQKRFQLIDGYMKHPSGLAPGCYSAPTQLAMVVAKALADGGCKIDTAILAKVHLAAAAKNRGWHADTLSSIDRHKSGTPYDQCGSASTDGEFLPKAIPLGLVAAVKGIDDEPLMRGCNNVIGFTHKGASQPLAAFAIAKVVRECARRGLDGASSLADPYELYQSDSSLFAKLVADVRSMEAKESAEGVVAERLQFARRSLQSGAKLDAFVGRNGNSRNFLEAMSFAVFCFMRSSDDRNMVKAVASWGRASALNAGLVGAMQGSYSGVGFLRTDDINDMEAGAATKLEGLAEDLLKKAS
jgi:ADP-ribosylglycohydrolase